MSGVNVKFVPFSSNVESPFWVRYCEEKLERIQLKEDAISIYGSYCVGEEVGLFPRLQCQEQDISLEPQAVTTIQNNEHIIMMGSLIGYNTKETFQKVDKNALLSEFFLDKFLKGDTSCLTSFVVITYPELKNHKVLYWFGIPTLLTCPGKSIQVTSVMKLSQLFEENTATSWRDDLYNQLYNMRLLQLKKKAIELDSLVEGNGGVPAFFIKTQESCIPLSKEAYETIMAEDEGVDVMFGFFDPIGRNNNNNNNAANDMSQITMGWPMRNLVAYLCFHLNLGGKVVQILSFRPQRVWRITDTEEQQSPPKPKQPENDESILLQVVVPQKEDYQWPSKNNSEAPVEYKVVGWELNAKQKMGPRMINLRPLLDTNHLAIQAADLNLKLMKWRMIPQLQLEKLQSLKVLMIGAGTLGCNVARILLGWGVRNFKIVDYGKVSYSNPVRQSLFTMDDCHDATGQQQWKAEAAAKALNTIAPDVTSEGIILSIPMPGHVESLETITKSVSTLDKLVQDCDVVYLLTDTRESRWLPTVMAGVYNKMLINSALGLDSWLVMRHGASANAAGGFSVNAANNNNRLGCYFCNDVVAPENSTKNRTLDQQCTVTRPGLAPIASSMAVELMVSLLHHPQEHAAPGPSSSSTGGGTFSPTLDTTSTTDNASTPLGIIPHQIRGSLVTYTMMVPTVPAFTHCTGCAQPVLDAYRTSKFEFVHKVCCDDGNSSFLENTSGLTEFRLDAANKMADLIDDNGDGDDDDVDDW